MVKCIKTIPLNSKRNSNNRADVEDDYLFRPVDRGGSNSSFTKTKI